MWSLSVHLSMYLFHIWYNMSKITKMDLHTKKKLGYYDRILQIRF